MEKYTLGIDFGSLSARAIVVNTANGKELGDAVMDYPHAVISDTLPASGEKLPADFALQDAADYLKVLSVIVPKALQNAGIAKEQIAGVGIDFTTSTVIAAKNDGRALSFLPEFRNNKHAYVKLWKHHAAGKYAARINEIAKERNEAFLSRCGGIVSGEWMFPKIYQVIAEAPEVYNAADVFVEGGDFITWQLTGKRVRAYPYAAYKSQYMPEYGYPSEDFLAAVDERLRHVVKEKLTGSIVEPGTCVGFVTKQAAARFGLSEGTPVAAAMPDGHVACAALNSYREGDLVAVFGTSACFYIFSKEEKFVPGICGIVPGGILPGLFAYEAGLCCFGDHFAYAAKNLISEEILQEATARGIAPLKLLVEKATAKAPGESGVLALDWFNGTRSILEDPSLSGLFVGITLATKPEDLLRALIEATAFATRTIFDNYATHGLPVCRVAASGGIARKDPFTMQVFADVLEKEIRIADTAQAPALGASVCAAVAAGIYPSFDKAVPAMSRLGDTVYKPNEKNAAVYRKLYEEYRRLHDYFGRGENNVMKHLRQIAKEAKEN